MTNQPIHADEPVTWAIAIHGGAGGDPVNWDAEKRASRSAGLKHALTAGQSLLAAGGTSLDAVETVIRILEDDASFNAGRGAVHTEDGDAELDASIMDGRTHACGAVAGITKTRNPISLARLVMTETKHVLLVGVGADEFAKQQNVPQVEPDYFLSRFDNAYDRVIDPIENPRDDEPHFGTVGCVALDSAGNLAAGTSTGGTAQKLPGRVGDSPIIGAGTYASNNTCAVSGTGIGEEYIRHSVAYDIHAQMKYAGQSLQAAVIEIIRNRLKIGTGGVIAISHDAKIVMQHNTPGMSCAAADSRGRFDTYLLLPKPDVDADTEVRVATTTVNEREITNMLLQQARDWSGGDIDAFMKAYWRSDQLTFSSGGKVTRGWDATLAGYKKRYPTKELMGKTTFSDLEFLSLGDSAMQVIGTWRLDRDQDPIGGKFTLVLRKFAQGWRIVHDHTSLKSD